MDTAECRVGYLLVFFVIRSWFASVSKKDLNF